MLRAWNRSALLALFAGIILLASIPNTLALPDTNTDIIGVDCSPKHLVSYSYSFQYPNAMEVGKTYTLTIVFKIASSQATQNPVKVSASITADGFTVDATTLNLLTSNTIRVTPQKIDATIKVVAALTLNGDTKQHPGYSAVYTDTITLKGFSITQPSTGGTLPGTGGTPTGNSTQPGTGGTGTGTNSTGTTPVPGSSTGNTTDPANNGGTSDLPPPDVSSEGNVSVYTLKLGDTVLVTVSIEVGDLSLVAWYTVRGVGLLAYFALSLSMLFAVFLKINRRAFPRLNRWHHEISLLAVVLALIHALYNLLDYSVWQLTVDRVFWVSFASANAVWISLGVVSLYMMIVVTASSFKSTMKRLKFQRWRIVHLSSYVLYVFVIVHSLLLGTDMTLLASTSALGLFVNFLFVLIAFANFAGLVYILLTRKREAKP